MSQNARAVPARLGARMAPAFASLIILSLSLVAAPVAMRELAAHRLQQIARQAASDPGAPGLEGRLRRQLASCGRRCPAEGLLAASSGLLQLALHAPQPARRADLVKAAEDAARAALKRSPVSAEGWTRLALAQTVAAEGALSPAASASLRTAYAAAPFHKPVAETRILLVAANWPSSPPELRDRARAEFVWLGLLDHQAADSILSRLPEGFVRDHLQLELAHRLRAPA